MPSVAVIACWFFGFPTNSPPPPPSAQPAARTCTRMHTHAHTHTRRATGCFPPERCSAQGVVDFAKELVVLMKLRHEHVVEFYGVYQHFEMGKVLSDR